MKTVPLSLMLVGTLVLAGCATKAQLERRGETEAAPSEFVPMELEVSPTLGGREGTRVGVLEVRVDDEVLAEAPAEYANIQRLLVEAVRRVHTAKGRALDVVDYTDLGYVAEWRQETEEEGWISFQRPEVKGVPEAVRTPVVMVAKVLLWRLLPEARRGAGPSAQVTLLLSSSTLEGEPVLTRLTSATQVAGGRPWEEAFWATVLEAVERYDAPFHPTRSVVFLVRGAGEDEGLSALERGEPEAALQAWKKRYEADPMAHEALHNAGALLMARGETADAVVLLERAVRAADAAPAVHSSSRDTRPWYSLDYEKTLETARKRMAEEGGEAGETTFRWRPASSVNPPSEPQPAAAPSAERCKAVQRGADGNLEWTRGLSEHLDDTVLLRYHPECRPPNGRCSIESYQVRWSNGSWSSTYRPGVNDLDHKKNPDGSARRVWSYFADHEHRYRYCRLP